LRQQLRHQGAVHCGRSALDRQAGLAISQLSIVVAASGGLDAQVTQQPGQRLLVDVVIRPVTKIADVAAIAQLGRPRPVRDYRN
jgi:hypothetical protein